MKLLLVHDGIYPDSPGSIEYRNHCLAQALAERGHDVAVAGWIIGPPFVSGGVTAMPLPYRTALRDASGRRRAVALLRFALATLRLDVGAYDAVETANIPYLHILPLALRCAWAGRPLIVTWYAHVGPSWRTRHHVRFPFAHRIVELLCAQLGRPNAIGPLTAERLSRSRRDGGREPVQVIPCGIWLRDIQKSLRARAEDVPPLFFAGRLNADNAVELLLRAVALMRASARPMEGVLLGIAGDGPDRERLEQLAASLGIAGLVTFYGHFPDVADMWKRLAGSRVAVQPNAGEGVGRFVLEALALGKPVVTCGLPDTAAAAFVRHGVEGLCLASEPAALAAGVSSLLDDAALWRRMSDAAYRRALDFDWSVIAEQIEALFMKTRFLPQPFDAD
jgi:glycosyltransferase involved in cell wall biosynthesis